MPHELARPLSRILAFVVLVFAAPVWAGDADPASLRIEQPWSRATAPGAPVGVGYLVIVNEGRHDDRLVGAETPRAARVMMHRSIEEDGTTRMEHQHKGIVIPAGERMALEPGGYHLMLMQLDGRLEKGDTVPLTLRFERAGEVGVELEVRSLTAGVE